MIKIFLLSIVIVFSSCAEDKITKVEYWDDGKVKYSIELDSDSLKHGFETKWYENGQKEEEIQYSHNVPIGTYKKWYQNGVLKYFVKNASVDTIIKFDSSTFEEITLVRRSGVGIGYYPNGKEKISYQIFKGKSEGKWRYWNENGVLIKEEFYRNDSLQRTVNY